MKVNNLEKEPPKMESEATLNAGDVCLDCQQKGLEKYLRYFKINLNGDTILKCESDQCMYPYSDELSSSDDEDTSLDTVPQTNSLKVINDLIQQFDFETEKQDTLSHAASIDESVPEQVTQFDITFLDDFHTGDNENLYKTETIDDEKQYYPVLETKSTKSDAFNDETLKNSSAAYGMAPNDNVVDTKEKIKIQSVETLKNESPLYYDLPTTSKNLLITGRRPTPPSLYPPLTAEDQQKNASKAVKIEPKTTQIKTSRLKKSETQASKSSNPSCSTLPVASKKVPKKSQSFDIPKADILKANAVLKKFATMEENEQSPTFNRKYKKYKKIHRNECDNQIGGIEKPKMTETPASLNTDSNYSLDKITQILLAKK